MYTQQQRITGFLLLTMAVLVADPALAQTTPSGGADWLTPAGQGVTQLTTSIVTIAGALIGLSIVAYGVWSALTHKIQWEKLWVFVFSGLLVTVGPTGIVWLISKFQAGIGS